MVRYKLRNQPKNKTIFDPSKLFIYYNERVDDGTVHADTGSDLRTAIRTISQQGVCAEADWSYNTANVFTKPPDKCYADAKKEVFQAYVSINKDRENMQQSLAQGYPFVFGFMVIKRFMSDDVRNTGRVPVPTATDEIGGGHAVLCVDYSDIDQTYTILNSWGHEWGDHGYFYLPYEYMEGPLCSDMWSIR